METNAYCFSIEDNRAYIIEENGHALLVDAPSAELTDIIMERGLILDYIFLTHEHCDHLWGLNSLRKAFGAKVIAESAASAAIVSPKTNRASLHHIYIAMRYGAEATRDCTPDRRLACERADIEFDKQLCLEWRGHRLDFIPTPGHSAGSAMLFIDKKQLFAGDTMLKGQQVFTMFESGSSGDYNEITLPFLRSLPGDTAVYPGHGEGFSMNEFEPREK